MASIFTKSGIWYIQICENGKTRQKSLKTRDRKIAVYRKNDIENQMSRGDLPSVGSPVTAHQAFEEFKRSREGVLELKTVRVVNQRIQEFLDDTHIAKLSHITKLALKEHLDRRIEKDNIAHKTANHSITQISTFMNYCVDEKYIKENPLRRMKKYRVQRIIPRFLSPNEAKELLSRAKTTDISDIIHIAVYFGLRWGEIERLEWENVDLSTGDLMVKESKTNKFRTVPICDSFKNYIKGRSLAGKVTAMAYDEMEHIFTDLREGFKIDGVAVPHFRFHDLRHTFASLAIRSGVDIFTLSKWLGHSTARTTELYAHLYGDHSQTLMKKFCI